MSTSGNNRALATIEGQTHTLVPSYSVSEIQQIATVIFDGGMFGMKSIPQVMTLLLVAQAEGIHPVNALREYHVIEGKPSLKADAMLARHQRSGGKVNWLKRTDTEVTAHFVGPLGEAKITWDQKRATQAQLWAKANFQKHPLQMLAARCVSEGVRAVNPAAIQGFYTPEEVQFFDDGQKQSYNPAERAAPTAAPDTRPEFEEVQPAAPVAAAPKLPRADDLKPPVYADKPQNGKYPVLTESDYIGLLYQFRRVGGASWQEAKKKLDANMLKTVNAQIRAGNLHIPKEEAHPRHLPESVAADWMATYFETKDHANWGEQLPFSLDDAARFIRGEWDSETGDLGEPIDMTNPTTT